MIFSKQAIRQALKEGKLAIVPFEPSQIDSAHIDLHLAESASLAPKSFHLGRTREKITLSKDLCGFMEGRAGLAKQGISIEQSSTFIEPGSDSTMMLEMFNAGDKVVELEAGQPIAKMFVMKLVDKL